MDVQDVGNCASELNEVAWRMWETARSESISAQNSMQDSIAWTISLLVALVALGGVLASMKLHNSMWPVAVDVGLTVIVIFGVQQYIGQVVRMFRAASYAYKIEERFSNDYVKIGNAEILLWEHYIGLQDNNIHKEMIFGVAVVLFGLLMILISPFWLSHACHNGNALSISKSVFIVSICMAFISFSGTYQYRIAEQKIKSQ